MKRIVDHKSIIMTNDEFKMYKEVCRSYDRPNFRGEDLFADHFETDGDGMLIFVKPPNKKYSTLEVYCFLVSLMVNQHIRLMHNRIDAFINDSKKNINLLAKDVEDKIIKINEPVKKAPVKKAKKKTEKKVDNSSLKKTVRRNRRS